MADDLRSLLASQDIRDAVRQRRYGVVLRRAENAGYSPADALTRTATARELRTARSLSEVLAWRINRHIAAHPAEVSEQAAAANDGTAATASTPAAGVDRPAEVPHGSRTGIQ